MIKFGIKDVVGVKRGMIDQKILLRNKEVSQSDFYLIRDGVLDSNYSAVPMNIDAYGYSSNGYYYVRDNDKSTFGVYINIDVTDFKSIEFEVRCSHYDGNHEGRVSINNAGSIYGPLVDVDVNNTAFAIKTIDISNYTGIKAIALKVYNTWDGTNTYLYTKNVVLKK